MVGVKLKRTLFLPLLACSLVGVFFVADIASAATYYVDGASLGGSCSDSNNGTALTTPWCTVQKAGTTAVAGDTVYIRGGTYRETVTMANSGTSGSRITYQNYNGETPIINGATAGSGWASLANTEANTGIFTEGFEGNDDTFASFTSATVDSGNTLTVEPDVPDHGTYSLKATFGGTNRNARVSKTITAAADVYQRMFFRINSAYNITSADVGQIIMNERIDSATSRASVELLRNASNQFYLRGRATNPATNSVTTFVTTAAGSIVPDTWYNIELRYKGGDATTGGSELWVDGVSQGSVYTWNTSTTTIGRLEWGGGTSGTGVASSGSIFYIDDAKASTTPIGAYSAAGAATTYKMTGISGDPVNVYQDGTLLATSSAYTALPAGTHYYDSANTTLYLRTSDSSNPSTKTIDIPNRTQGIVMLEKEYITLDGLTVKYTRGSGNLHGGIIAATSSNITIQNSTSADNNGAGIFFQRTATSTISTNSLLRNHRDFGGGVRLENGSNNNLIVSNTITGLGVNGGNGIVMCGDDTCNDTGNNSNTIRSNTFYNLRDSCVYVGSRSDYNIMEKNLCGLTYRITSSEGSSAGGSGFHISRGSDYNIIRNNIIYDTQSASIVVQSNTINGVEFAVYGNEVYNNVIYNPVTLVSGNHGGISVLDDAYGTIIRNNIVYQSNDVAGIRVTGAAATTTTTTSNNLYYSTRSGATNMFHWGTSSGTFYTNLTTLRAAYPTQEANSISVDPLFANAASLNFKLVATSTAINVGATVATTTDDYLGNARPQNSLYDIGAYEFLPATQGALTQVNTSDSSSLSTGGNPTGTSVTFRVAFTTANSTDVVTPEFEIRRLGTPFTNTATHTGSASTVYSSSGTASVAATLDPNDYRWQARLTNAGGATSWASFGNNSENAYDLSFAVAGGGGGGGAVNSGGSAVPPTTTPSSVSATTTDTILPTPILTPVPPSIVTPVRLQGTLQMGDRGVSVSMLQDMLSRDSSLYPDAVISGFYGSLTQKAVERFQIKYGLVSTGTPLTTGFGRVGPMTLAKLNEVFGGPVSTSAPSTPPLSLTRTLNPGETSTSVSILQQMLATDPAVYPDGRVTGFYGPLTQKAVERFQIKYDIVTSGTSQTTGFGRVGPMTLIKLNEVLGK